MMKFLMESQQKNEEKQQRFFLELQKQQEALFKSLSNNKPTYHHHHHIVLAARISLTLSRHSSLSFIALGRSSGQHPVSSHSCWMYVRAGRPAFARPCVGIHKSTSLMSSSLLLQQCPACLVRLTWIDFVIGGRWPYSWCLSTTIFPQNAVWNALETFSYASDEDKIWGILQKIWRHLYYRVYRLDWCKKKSSYSYKS